MKFYKNNFFGLIFEIPLSNFKNNNKMKKIITLLAVIGMFGFQGCTGPEGPPGIPGQDGQDGAVPYAFEIKNVNLGRVVDNEYNLKSTFQFEIGDNLRDDETVLMYRLTDLINSSTPVWQSIPRTTYFDDGNILDYYFDFSKVDFIITARGSFNLALAPDYIKGQTFRIVLIPSNLVSSVNVTNYNEVMAAANLKESEVKKIDF
jgi:hypothetical protein